ncbi:MAG: NADH-quinone oxidoreductase subunit NuoG [Chitinophagaceae bacterium]
MPTVYIDNQPYEIKAGKNLLEGCLSLGFDLPYFCWHPSLGSVGACRQCAVKMFRDEKDQQGRLVMSCMENVTEGLRLSVTDATAKAFREQVIEWLMTNHPHDCPVCDEGGSCHLQDMTVMTGHDYRRYNYKKRTYRNQYLGPLINHEMNRCIQCYRCTRYYRDYAGGKDLNVFGAHNHVYFGREKDGVLESPFSGNLAEVCPTGVFTDKTLKEHYTRKWDLTSAPSICHHCSLGCNIIAGERYGKLRSITNRYNSEVNGYFLCDRGRFGYEFVNSENRITQPVIRNRVIEAVDEGELMNHLRSSITQKKMIGIGSPRASVETNFSLMQLVGRENFYQGVTNEEAYLHKLILDMLQSGSVHSCSLKEIEQADAVLVLGEDVWNTAPMMALAVRQSVMKTAASNALHQTPLPAWHDNAIKELVQEGKGFLANITLSVSPLDELAACAHRAAPDDIARLAFAIAHQLNPDLPAVSGLNEDTVAMVTRICTALEHAKNPVIISGTSLFHEAIIKATFDIVMALKVTGKKAGLSYVLRECNSMGLAMMQAPSFNQAADRVTREPDLTVIIVEQDIYRSIPQPDADAFFNNSKHIITLDALNTATTGKAQVLIPAASFAEADGTLVNNEGRAQHFYQVFMNPNRYIRESWRWLLKIKDWLLKGENGQEHYPDQILAELETAFPQFAGIVKVMPPHDHRVHGQNIPREPHRYSGRTAILANIQVSEPKPLQDADSLLSFTMEGYRGIPPSSAIPFFWSPGWNSVQSVNKYQQEVGGALLEEQPGVKLFTERPGTAPNLYKDFPEAFVSRQQKWLLLPKYDVFGSGELSIYTQAIKELSPGPYITLSAADAEQMGLSEGATVSLKSDKIEYTFPVKIQAGLCKGIVLMPAGLRQMPYMHWGSWVSIYKPVHV